MQIAIFEFEEITKYKISTFLSDVATFFTKDYKKITDYYDGSTNEINSIHLDNHNRLLNEADKITSLFIRNKNAFNTIEFWELLEFFEDIKTKLQKVSVIKKYIRSSRDDMNYLSGIATDYTIGSEQTLEEVSQLLQEDTPDDDWINIAVSNDLKEIGYTIDGGKKITLYKERFIRDFVTSVLDTMNGEKIYGLDINKKIKFVNNDLDVLSYKDTVYQAVDILSKLKKGDIPEYPSIGIDNIFVGSNLSAFSYSAIIRDLTRNFETDDLFINFKIKELKIEQDSLHIDFEINTKYELLIQSKTII